LQHFNRTPYTCSLSRFNERVSGTLWRWSFFKSKLSCKIYMHIISAIPKCEQKILFQSDNLSTVCTPSNCQRDLFFLVSSFYATSSLASNRTYWFHTLMHVCSVSVWVWTIQASRTEWEPSVTSQTGIAMSRLIKLISNLLIYYMRKGEKSKGKQRRDQRTDESLISSFRIRSDQIRSNQIRSYQIQR
jgi:hypothetical protein